MKNIQYSLLRNFSGVLLHNFDMYIKNSNLSLYDIFIINSKEFIKSLKVNDSNFGCNILEILRKLKIFQYVENNLGKVYSVNWNNNIETLKYL